MNEVLAILEDWLKRENEHIERMIKLRDETIAEINRIKKEEI